MSSKISVIVAVCNTQKYLVRCLNSIKRQTYENVEIIIVTKDKTEEIAQEIKQENGIRILNFEDNPMAMADAINTAQGEYVYFCSSDSILTDNTLQVLIDAKDKKSICPYVSVGTLVGVDYLQNRMSNISLYGKLFDKENLCKVIAENMEEECFDEIRIVVAYLSQCDGTILSENAMVYETEENNLINGVTFKERSDDDWKNILQIVSDNCKNEQVHNYITVCIGEVIVASGNNIEEIMYYAQEKLHNDIWLNFVLSKNIIKKWWDVIRSNENQKIYNDFKSYLLKYENEVVFEMLLNECGINETMYKIIKNNEQYTVLQILDKLKKNGNLLISQEPVIITVQGQTEEPSGVALADYIVDKYRNGSLGLKTIIRSLTAWIKFKL